MKLPFRVTPGRAVGWLVVLAVVAILVAIPDPQEFARAHGAKQRLSVATGGTGGVWYPYGGGVAQVITAHVPGIEATAEVTAASIDNLKLLQMGRVDLAFSIADALIEAYLGEGPFREFGRVPVRTLAVLYPHPVQLVTVESTGIESMGDLRGRVVSVGAPGSGTEILALRMLEAAGIDPETGIRAQGLSVAESVNAIRDGKIDAFFWNSGLPAGAVLDLANTPNLRMRMLPTDEVLPELQRRFGEQTYFLTEVPKETYAGMTEDVPTVGVAAILVVAEELDEELAYQITRALFERQPDLLAVHPSAAYLTLDAAIQGSPVPFHPGAIRYYEEMGVWTGSP
jgi:TRAP transporter TAXI family solute receptor